MVAARARHCQRPDPEVRCGGLALPCGQWIRGSDFQTLLHHLAQQGQGDGALALQRGGIERVQHGEQAGQLAAAVAQQELDHLVGEAQAAARGQGEEDGGARVVVQSLDFIDQGLTDARAQIFAQRQSERGARPRQQQRLTVAAAAIERVEERDLGWGRELVDVVYRQHGVRGFGQYGSDVGSAKAMGGAAAGLGLG
ncbi:hypothetical protein M622_10240 [Thauera terpenica 58Eu]|uniref:Uncharacterized protein n=1 Tax=Thauera terpenica 58Eu TaxID=1348657 RepID=T0AVH8_9RHOO|nr:hypothetical protein M622_10240 [Thauera terpenica 58Eu]